MNGLQVAHYTMHTAHCTLPTAHCILHTVQCTLYTDLTRVEDTMSYGLSVTGEEDAPDVTR